MDLLSLHFNHSRDAAFKAADDIFYSTELKCWVAFRPETVVELLRDEERLVVPEITETLTMLETRYKKSLPNLLYAARCIPLLIEGQAHREVRRNLAELVSKGRARTTAAMPELMSRYIAPLERESDADWISASLAPLTNEVFGHMCGCPTPLPFPRLVLTRVFDRFVGLSALAEAERQIGDLREKIAETAPDADPAHIVALYILGRDSLLGTLATSLHAVLRRNIGRRFAEIDFPDFPPETGVAIAERIATAAIPVGQHVIAPGERVRMYFQPISDAGGAVSRQSLFGAGIHSCLGRPISLDVWNAMIAAIGRYAGRVAAVACEFQPSNIFVVPHHLKIEQAA